MKLKKTLSNIRNIIEQKWYLFIRKNRGTKITLSMVVKNESSGYLKDVLENVKPYISNAVILDDFSSDNTIDICEQILRDVNHKIYKNKKSMFHREYRLRQKLLKLTLKEKPDWILVLDADEIFVINDKDQFEQDLKENDDLLKFTLFDMWTPTEFRNDENWNGHTRPWPFMMRPQKFFHYRWRKTNQHCGRFPANMNPYGRYVKSAYIKHLGWLDPNRREDKYYRYLKLDNLGEQKYLKQYETIMDSNPNLTSLEEYIKENL